MLQKLLRAVRGKPARPQDPGRWPEPGKSDVWMRQKLDYLSASGPETAALLFDISSGDYLPGTIHAGSFFGPEELASYRRLKTENPELVKLARQNASPYSRSVICDPEDLPDHPLLP